jgi:hypothetical protein
MLRKVQRESFVGRRKVVLSRLMDTLTTFSRNMGLKRSIPLADGPRYSLLVGVPGSRSCSEVQDGNTSGSETDPERIPSFQARASKEKSRDSHRGFALRYSAEISG